MKFVFLILHYMNVDVTVKCMDSLLQNISGVAFDIVVVDNASNNGSYEELTGRYKEYENIHFLCNKENLGYARGNNVGFVYAKDVLKADWICLLNNDVFISDTHWMDKIYAQYEKKPFYVLGPDVVTPEGIHQNPFADSVPSKKRVAKKLFHDEVVYMLLKLGIQRKLRSKMKAQPVSNAVDWKQSREEFAGVLHGSCLIFSPDYVKEFDGLYSGTFLYAEEEILCYILHKLGYPYAYCTDLQAVHCHATSFKKSIADEDRRKMVIVKHRIRSYRKFLKIVMDTRHPEKYLKR